ncbi:MAG: DNA sulfur modification protein DndD [Desulfobacteraceae bacterium]|nr:DNA sulfur modification protein DndD [Desulfobacteraceae bacterium]MBC2719651.1 DNA sulfur modification protein DndD [Desulfobacteraceae bacterium]
MIIREVHIHNLFSYYGTQTFAFSPPENSRNITLISGRNGFGKTSFMESVKLLFLGTDKLLLNNIQRGRSLSPKAYLLGTGEEWLGIMNCAARNEGEEEFSVRVIWEEESGTVDAKRSWHLQGRNDYNHKLEVIPSFGRVPEEVEEAQGFLHARIPRDIVSFFIYDGEQVQAIAEANREELLEQIERLFGLDKLDTLSNNIEINIRKWRREGSPSDANHRLRILEKELAEYEAKLASETEKLERNIEKTRDLEIEIEKDLNYLQSKQAYAHEHKAELLKRDFENKNEQLQEKNFEVALNLPQSIPLLVNPDLIFKAINILREQLNSESGILTETLRQILKDLPRDLFNKGLPSTPPLIDNQKDFYKTKLNGLLSPYLVSGSKDSRLFSLEYARAKRLYQNLEQFIAPKDMLIRYSENLRAVSRLRKEIEKINDKIHDMSSLEKDEKERYEARKRHYEENKIELDEKKEQKIEIEGNIRDIKENKVKSKQKEIDKQKQTVRLAHTAKQRVQLGDVLKQLYSEYKARLIKNQKENMENSINEHFSKLMSSHKQISRIEILDDFSYQYIGYNKTHVGMAGLSAGMKQLFATSLLWTLKDVSGKSLPVIIDTPLARFDRGHQQNLLTHYYPHAGDQVILLPTDSELDKEKYNILKPHILEEYRLNNPDGEHTSPERKSMYS